MPKKNLRYQLKISQRQSLISEKNGDSNKIDCTIQQLKQGAMLADTPEKNGRKL